MSEYIEVGQPLQFTDPNTPTRVGEIVENVSDIYNIPSPRLGMQVFVKSEKKSFVITSLKNKVIGGVDVPEAAVEAFEPVGAKSITWNNDNDPSNKNDFVVAGVYDIKGERTRIDDNLPILNTGSGHSFNARLTVLDSSISGSGKDDDKCITQVLSFSNRLGQGEVYIRTGKGSSLDSLSWEKWSTLQRNVNVGSIDQAKMDDLTDNGIYSGILSTTGETFVIICINNYAIAQQVGVQHISHLKYSLVVGTGEVKIEKRTRDAYGIWTEWENIGGGSTLPEATVDTVGGVRLGTNNDNQFIPLVNISNNGTGVGIKLNSNHFVSVSGSLKLNYNRSLRNEGFYGVGVALGTFTNFSSGLIIPCVIGTGQSLDGSTWNTPSVGILYNKEQFCLKYNGLNLKDDIGAGITKITWDSSSNMNDFKTPGVYDIYGERTRQDDNLPILNASSGHSIAARLTVVASTLQPDNNEICVTQFLQLSNRVGGEGATYVRTYNENNNSMNGWSPWQKQMGMVETLINSDTATVGQEIFSDVAQKIGDGLNGMIDNGIYSGIYIDKLSYTGNSSLYYLSGPPTFVETFVLVVINDYAASGNLNLPRHITQLKYAVDAMTGQSTVKKRVGTGDDIISWGDWEDIGGGGSVTIEVSYSTLLNLRDTESLIPGMKYRITDYITTTAQENTVSAGKPFDIIVTADTINSLNENAAACQNKDDGYFDDINFSAWELKYCLDNDTSRFAWADAENGKGVIYHMKDEHNNECPYDFKNIMFVRYKLNAPTVGGYPNEWQNRMSENINKMFEANQLSYLWHGVSDEDDCYWEDEMSEVISSPTGEAKAFFTFSNVIDDVVTDKSKTPKCHSNIIKESYQGNLLALNNNVFFSTVVTNDCNSNSFGNDCNYNGFFDDGSYAFDDNENEYLYDGIPLDYVQNNKFGDGCSHLLIYNVSEVGPDESIQNLNIAQGFSSISIDTANGVFYPEVIEIDTVGQDYEIKIARNSKGDVKIYCEADLIL